MEVREASAIYAVLARPQVPEGYKQTEVGVIPEDWECPSISEIAANRPNAIVGGPFGSDLVSKDYADTGVPVVRGQNMGRQYVSGDFVFVSKQKAKQLQANTARADDIIFTQRGTLGQVAIVPHGPFGGYVVSQSQMKLTLNSDLANCLYVYQYFISADGQRQILDSAIQTGVPHTNLGILRSYKIPLPPTKAEQEAIAEALSDADAFIESLEQLLAKKRRLKQGAMQELLTGKKRLPGFSGEWEVKPLGGIAEIVMGQSPSSTHYNNKGDGLPLIQGNADISDRKTIKRIFTTEVTKLGRCGDILMSVRAPVGEISRAVFDVCLGRGVCAIRYSNDFLYHALITKEASWAKLSKGSTFDSVNSTDVKAFDIELPKAEVEQSAIATLLSDLDAELAALEAKLAKARRLKQGMMRELLTGRIRLAGGRRSFQDRIGVP